MSKSILRFIGYKLGRFIPDKSYLNFRYKKVVLLMGANATGKTSLGKALLKIFKYINSGNTSLLLEMVEPNTIGSFTIDFVNDGYVLHRLSAVIDSNKSNIELVHAYTNIEEKDSYEIGIVIKAEFRGKGISSPAIGLLCDKLKDYGVKNLYHELPTSRLSAIKSDINNGFVIKKENIDGLKKFGKIEKLTYLEKTL